MSMKWTVWPGVLYYLIMRDIGLAFLHCDHFPRCKAVVDKHFPDYCTLQLMSRGGIELTYDEQRYELKGSWLWPCWPGPLIRFRRLPRCAYWVHRYVAFKGPLVSRWTELGLLPFAPQRPPANTRYVEQFDELLSLVRRGDRLGRFRAINLLEAILFQLADDRGGQTHAWLDDVRERLDRQATLWPEYESIARDMGIGLSTLRRQFRDEAGVSLHRHVLQRRIGSAQDLLGETSLPIKTIAQKLGYRDVYFFSRQFRQMSGVTPGAYRLSRQA
jgi:AraC-like DNA-binding protein